MLDGTVIFCKDGVLRFESRYDDKHMVPVTALQDVLELEPSEMVMSLLRHDAVLDSGSTLGSFLLCLAPWAEQMNWLTDRQVTEYIKEIRKPSAEVNAFDRIELRRRVHAHRSMIHETIPEDVDIFDWLNRDRTAPLRWSDSWSVDSTLDICGYVDGDPSNYSMSTDVHKLKNVPIVVNRSTLLMETVSKACDKQALFNKAAEGTKTVTDRNITLVSATVERSITFYELIETVVCDGLWHDTPQGARNMATLLSQRLEQMLEDDDSSESVPEERPRPALSLVDENYSNNATDAEQESSLPKVVIAEGAFDGLSATINKEVNFWESLLKSIEITTDHVIRIGTYSEDTVPDDRVMGGFIE